jgi:hypothetical protein
LARRVITKLNKAHLLGKPGGHSMTTQLSIAL